MTDTWSEFESPFGEAEGEFEFEDFDSEYLAEFEDEAPWGESPFGEAAGPVAGETWLESPFTEFETVGGEFESFGGEFESPFGELWTEGQVATATPGTNCGKDVPYPKRSTKNLRPRRQPSNQGVASPPRTIVPAEHIKLRLSAFDVDSYELKPNHRTALQALVRRLEAAVRAKRYPDKVLVQIMGEASSTASITHNVVLSEHRAYNVYNAFLCLLTKDVANRFDVRWVAIGEERSERITGDAKENADFRGVVIRTIARVPVRDCPPTPPPAQTNSLCLSVPRIEPRVRQASRPGVVNLGSLLPRLPGPPLGMVPNARALVKVDRGPNSGLYDLVGWGLEVPVPTVRGQVNLSASISASLDVLARAAASVAGRFQVGVFGIKLRVDASAFASLLVKLCAQIKVDINIAISPGLTDPTACTVVESRPPNFDLRSLSGPALLIVPPPRAGAAMLRLGSQGVTSGAVRLSRNPVPVPADKSTVKHLLVIQGVLQPPRITAAARREAEADEVRPGEWAGEFEADPFLEAELLPFG